MQSEQQYEQLILQYTQLKNGAEEISRMIDIQDFDSALSMIKAREEIFLNCKCMRKYLELTPVEEKALNKILDELRELEMNNIRKLSQSMVEVKKELKTNIQNEKIQQAYDFDESQRGSIVNITE